MQKENGNTTVETKTSISKILLDMLFCFYAFQQINVDPYIIDLIIVSEERHFLNNRTVYSVNKIFFW